MRKTSRALLAALTLAGPTAARAADLDYDFLRGPEYDPPAAVTTIDWSGVYVGGHGGYTSAALGFKNAFKPALADHFAYRDIETEFGVSSFLTGSPARVGGASYGAFAGYNFQLDDVVVGIEADYTRFDKSGFTNNAIWRNVTTSGGIYEVIDLSGRSTTKIEDYGTIRARAGYAMGSFLPFVTGGLAIGRASIQDDILVQNYGYDQTAYQQNQTIASGAKSYVYNHDYASFNPNYPGVKTTPDGGGVQTVPNRPIALPVAPKTKTVGGVALGGGLEYAITPNILLRAEYQYVLFNDFDGHKANVNTVRGGAAVKF